MRAIGVLVALIVTSAAPVRADDKDLTDTKLADQKFIEGRDRLKQNDFEGACLKFHEAQKFDEKAVVILLNLGLCYEKQNKVASALKWYRKTQTASSESPDPAAVKEYEDAAKEATARLTPKVATVTFVPNDLQADAVMTIDGTQIIDRNELTVEVDAGTRVIEANAPGKMPIRKELAVKDGQKGISFNFAKLADIDLGGGPPRTKRRVVGIGIALGTVAVAGVITGLYAKGQQDKFNDPMTGGQQNNPNVKRNMRIAGGVFVAASVAGLAAGGYFFFSKPKETNRTAWTPMITPDQVGVAFSGGF